MQIEIHSSICHLVKGRHVSSGVWIGSRFLPTGEFFLGHRCTLTQSWKFIVWSKRRKSSVLWGLRPTLKWCCRCSCWGRFSATGGRTSQDWAWGRWRAVMWFGRCSPLHWRTGPRKRDKVWERWRWSERAPAGSGETALGARALTAETSCPPCRSPTIRCSTLWEVQEFYIADTNAQEPAARRGVRQQESFFCAGIFYFSIQGDSPEDSFGFKPQNLKLNN